MDFTLSQDHVELRDGVREFCARRYGEDLLRAQTPADRALWSDLGELGVFALRLPEDLGGAGLGYIEAVLAFEGLGRALVPGPVVASHVCAGFVEGAADGSTVVGWLDADVEPLIVEYAGLVDTVVVNAGTDLRATPVAALELEPVEAPTDPLVPVALVRGALPEPGPVGPGLYPPLTRRDAALFTAAYQLGIAASVTDRSVAYAKEREQFGRPIGSFQAVKHMCADMFVRAELAKAAVYAAAVTLDDPEVGDSARTVAAAKLLANEAALLNAKAAIQVHGGMGFTWEMPLHLYLKRAWVLSTTFGSADEHALALADAV
jgi:alkylation response protein AidB-like acyl-CoA dehydrogenase